MTLDKVSQKSSQREQDLEPNDDGHGTSLSKERHSIDDDMPRVEQGIPGLVNVLPKSFGYLADTL